MKKDNTVRNIIIDENNKLHKQNVGMIDSKEKCINFLISRDINYNPCTENWIKYCLGNNLFNIIKANYYYTKDELANACDALQIHDFDDYKQKYMLDVRLPSPNYINDGFYQDLDKYFNLSLLLCKTKDCVDF